jgi:hypothetical protein
MPLETLLSVAPLAAFIWAVRFMLPRAVRARDGLALACAVLTALLALVAFLSVGVRMRSTVTLGPEMISMPGYGIARTQ